MPRGVVAGEVQFIVLLETEPEVRGFSARRAGKLFAIRESRI